MRINQVCPICESINSPKSLICSDCHQDLRAMPLQDYLVFAGNSVESRKNDLIFQFGILKHKVKISFDSIRFLIEQGEHGRMKEIYSYYRTQIERERSAASYYLRLFSSKIFHPHYGLLFLDIQVYFTLLKSFIYRLKLPENDFMQEIFQEGFSIIQDQKEKLVDTIDDIIEEIEDATLEDINTREKNTPPPPLIPALISGWRSI